jgi:predicted nucleic acid-binding protein
VPSLRVVDASPLIHLARAGLLELLREPRPSIQVLVPSLVFEEVMSGEGYDPTARLVEAASRDWLTIVPAPPPHPAIRLARIDAGEIAVLSLALAHPGASVVLDDRAARTEANRLGLPTTGTLR